MECIKAFGAGLVCKGFQYEVGKTYTMPRSEVKLCRSGFHAANGTDPSLTLDYYQLTQTTEYCLVDINVIDSYGDKVVGDKIKILRKLSLDEVIELDETGRWCTYLARDVEGADIKKLQAAVINKDETGELCLYFAEYVEGADIKKLQAAVAGKDKNNWWVKRLLSISVKELQNE